MLIDKDYYWYFKNAIGSKTCDDIIKLGLEKKPKLNTWTDYFNKNSKKDDLADAFLQCLWYINNIINKK